MSATPAIEQGSPIREDALPFHLPLIEEEDFAAVADVLRSGWLTTGPKAKQLEEALASACGVTHALALNSGTAALHLALEALGVRRGDEVLIPAYTFAATGEVVAYLGATPVLVDSGPDGFNMSLEDAGRRVTPKTRAMIAVHIGGLPCDIPAFAEFAKARGLFFLEDAAHALPASYDGVGVGQASDAAALSFYATKNITTAEGGMLLTKHAHVMDRARVMALHGISRDAWKRYTKEGTWRYDIMAAGFKYNLTDLAAALGLSQFAKSDRMLARRALIADRYDAAFTGVPGLIKPPRDERAVHSWHLYSLRLDESRLTISRDRFIDALKAEGILTSVHFIPLHLHSHYQKTYGYKAGQFPHAERHFKAVISLPIYPRMTDTDINDVTGAVLKLAKAYSQ